MTITYSFHKNQQTGSKVIWGSVFLETFIFAQLVKKFFAVMSPDGSLKCSQKLARGLILSQLNPIHTLTSYFSKINFNVIFPSIKYEIKV
jgi:hypothetical protein